MSTTVQNTILEPQVPVTLGGKVRQLRVDFNALALIEERTGKSVMQMSDWQSLKTRDLRSMVWAALVHEDPTLTEQEVGSMLTMTAMTEIMSAFGRAMYISMKGELPPEGGLPQPAAEQEAPTTAPTQAA